MNKRLNGCGSGTSKIKSLLPGNCFSHATPTFERVPVRYSEMGRDKRRQAHCDEAQSLPKNSLSHHPTKQNNVTLVPTASPELSPDWTYLIERLRSELPMSHFIGVKTLLAVSGGADSVAMLRLVVDVWSQTPGLDHAHLSVAHFNHGLRGCDSDGDQKFVEEAVCELGLPLFAAQSTATIARDEANLRSLRYEFLRSTANSIGARYVMVAHTCDDNIETFLHHLFRGSGTTGLAGIRRHRDLGPDLVLYRPLLGFSGRELRSGLTQIGQSWREDATNCETVYQRNWLRNKLLPVLRTRYPRADSAILRAIDQFSRLSSDDEKAAMAWIDQNVRYTGEGVTFDRSWKTKTQCDTHQFAAIVRLLWDHLHWPRASLDNAHLSRLYSAWNAQSSSHSFTMPGDVQCHVREQEIELYVSHFNNAMNNNLQDRRVT